MQINSLAKRMIEAGAKALYESDIAEMECDWEDTKECLREDYRHMACIVLAAVAEVVV